MLGVVEHVARCMAVALHSETLSRANTFQLADTAADEQSDLFVVASVHEDWEDSGDASFPCKEAEADVMREVPTSMSDLLNDVRKHFPQSGGLPLSGASSSAASSVQRSRCTSPSSNKGSGAHLCA